MDSKERQLRGQDGNRRRVAAAERRARAQYEAAVAVHADLDRRVRHLELKLQHEQRPALRARLLEELDALTPLRDAAEEQVGAFGGVHAAARARLVAERLR